MAEMGHPQKGKVFELLHWMWTPAGSGRSTAKSRCSPHPALTPPSATVEGPRSGRTWPPAGAKK